MTTTRILRIDSSAGNAIDCYMLWLVLANDGPGRRHFAGV